MSFASVTLLHAHLIFVVNHDFLRFDSTVELCTGWISLSAVIKYAREQHSMLFRLLRCSYNLEFLHDSEALDLLLFLVLRWRFFPVICHRCESAVHS